MVLVCGVKESTSSSEQVSASYITANSNIIRKTIHFFLFLYFWWNGKISQSNSVSVQKHSRSVVYQKPKKTYNFFFYNWTNWIENTKFKKEKKSKKKQNNNYYSLKTHEQIDFNNKEYFQKVWSDKKSKNVIIAG